MAAGQRQPLVSGKCGECCDTQQWGGSQLRRAGDQAHQHRLVVRDGAHCTHGRATVTSVSTWWALFYGYSARSSSITDSCSLSSQLLAHSKGLLMSRAPWFCRVEKEMGEHRGLLCRRSGCGKWLCSLSFREEFSFLCPSALMRNCT